ncbi:MAG: hypothetical protein KatS3mg032_0417 [Cyclobacteriaceae bacterium]|nr:MAG: hypothetical protein KatS3mg032_0417 [Cyclobacteriaceae bacterium]
MPITATSCRLLKKIRDEKFDEDRIDSYNLALLTGPRDLQVMVYDPQNLQALWLEDYVFPSAHDNDGWLASLQELFDQHPFISAGFWKKIIIGVKTTVFVHHPESLFSEADAATCLGLSAAIHADEEVHTFHTPAHNMVTSFALPVSVKNWFTSAYPGNRPCFVHQSCALIEGTLQESPGYPDAPLYIYVDRFRLHILAADRSGLRYYNQFAIQNFNDYIRYIMLVMHTLHIDQRTSRVIMWGYVGKNSPHYQEFYKYIRTITYGNRPEFLRYGYVFDEVQEHQYFDVLNMARLPVG